ncbi:MAG: hypothetical protein DLM61_16870 [Pseudonocardiales bacterium]|nr:MAG: hypothetical protein DLM61_16870 [Pseudonocardiales bacterium]
MSTAVIRLGPGVAAQGGGGIDTEVGEPLAQHADGVSARPGAVGMLEFLEPTEQVEHRWG